MHPAEEERIRKVQAGDLQAFGPIVERYQGLVFTYLRRQGMDSEGAADVLQETFAKALQGIGSLREPGAFKAWLLRIAHNELVKDARKRRDVVADLGAEESQALLARAQETLGQVDPAEVAGKYLDARRVLDRMDRLATIYRETLLLRFQGGLQYKEIAEVLGITVENAKFRVHHGLKLLRAMLVAEGR